MYFDWIDWQEAEPEAEDVYELYQPELQAADSATFDKLLAQVHEWCACFVYLKAFWLFIRFCVQMRCLFMCVWGPLIISPRSFEHGAPL